MPASIETQKEVYRKVVVTQGLLAACIKLARALKTQVREDVSDIQHFAQPYPEMFGCAEDALSMILDDIVEPIYKLDVLKTKLEDKLRTIPLPFGD